MRILTDIEILRDLLSYDTEELSFLSFMDRCEIHRNIARIMRHQKISFSQQLENKLIEKVLEIRKSGWKRPNMRWEIDHQGEFIKVRYN